VGPHRRIAPRERSGFLIPIAQVVPDLPTFAVDAGFRYRIPDTLEGITVGSMVRVPLGGRRVRGYVVELRSDEGDRRLKDIAAVSGDVPVFGPRLLETLRWAAVHYVAPLAAVLGKAAPPNLPRGRVPTREWSGAEIPSPLPQVTAALQAGRHAHPAYLVGSGPWLDDIAGLAAPVLTAERTMGVVLPTLAEAEVLAGALTARLGPRVVLVSSSLPARDVTRAWLEAERGNGRVVVGTREIALWPLGTPALWFVVEEGRRAMKAPQTPTLHVRDVLRRRAAVERSALVFAGAVPTVETLSRGVDVHQPSHRIWPLVEVVDRATEPPGGGVVMEATRRAIAGALQRQEPVFVFVSRHGYAPAFRCVRCRALRRCPRCGAGPGRGDVCRRCGAEVGPCRECGGRRFEPLGAAVGRVLDELRGRLGDAVGPPDSARPVRVGTERDLPGAGPVALAVAIDADSLLLAPHYRAEEDALRLLARVAALVRRGRGHRCLLQTAQPQHRVIAALRGGRPGALLEELTVERVAEGFPPATELLAVEAEGGGAGLDVALREAVAGDATTHGPAEEGDRQRWLLQATHLDPVRLRLRPLVQTWRDGGVRVRIDADPVDL
jgi:primosomal protein N' (replication factor Y)